MSKKKEKSKGEDEKETPKDSELPNQKSEDDDDDEDENKNDNDAATEEGKKRKRKRKRKKKAAEPEEDDQEKEEGEEQVQQRDLVDCTVYVEGIPFDANPDQVREFFETNGIADITELRLPTWQDSGRLRGYGHVLFGSQESYDKGLKLSGKHMGKRYLTIQPSNSPSNGSNRVSAATTNPNDPPPKDCKTLFVNNLPYNASETEIAAAFEKCGVTISEEGVRIARNSVTRQSKGFCYVDFERPEDAVKVMQSSSKKSVTVGGRTIRLDYDTGRIKGSYRAESGRLWTKEAKEKQKRPRHKY